MKRFLSSLLALVTALCLCALPCLAEGDNNVTPDVLDALVELQPLGVISANYVESTFQAGLQVIVQNNTDAEISGAVVAFAAWNGAGQPVMMKGYLDMLGSAAYVIRAELSDIDLAPGATFGESNGLRLNDTGMGIENCRAVVVSYDTADGTHWENPYFLNWCEMYEGKPFDPASTIVLPASADELAAAREQAAKNEEERQASILTNDELEAEIAKQSVRVINTVYKKDANNSLMGGDMLQMILKNDTQDTIQSAVVAVVAWDAAGQPVQILEPLGLAGYLADYTMRMLAYDDINMAPGGSFGNNSGYAVSADSHIAQFKAIVQSYETDSGETWENPLFDQWVAAYKGVPLEDAASAQ